MYWVLWTTNDGREHHRTFGNYGKDLTERQLEEVEKFCKELWQNSVIKDEDRYKLSNMTVIDGKHVSWEKKEVKVIKEFRLTHKEGEVEE